MLALTHPLDTSPLVRPSGLPLLFKESLHGRLLESIPYNLKTSTQKFQTKYATYAITKQGCVLN